MPEFINDWLSGARQMDLTIAERLLFLRYRTDVEHDCHGTQCSLLASWKIVLGEMTGMPYRGDGKAD
ncbi:hypothetical protein N7462_006526 [Penicillium macrosclerotiorum]|uniref:uncharacterized protein n=1 Tax=Penicillium macrosclerotiorum TaxID=303699 RepID=UPI0025492F9A|nr:uncharacterized protein N7462_006526 [Penicillium macrosclerotiorum]KAJ5683361.1 hypothetical protein N7462_006526 [Penicillium macrosclerotiorum]